MKMKNTHIDSVRASLPKGIRSFTWVRNHHYVELEDANGNRVKLNADAVLIGECEACKERCIALSNTGAMMCTHCGGCVRWAWSKPQLAFIPEQESKFMGWAVHKNPKGKA